MFKRTREEWDFISKMGYPEDDLAAEGYYIGGEKIVEWKLGTEQILPFNLSEIIDAGIKSLSNNIIKLKNPEEITLLIKSALEAKKGFSLIRLGDGECLTLGHDIFLTADEINNNPRLRFLSYAGVTLPNHKIRDLLTKNMVQADVVGVPLHRCPTYQHLFNKLANYYNWPLKKMCLTNSIINYQLNETEIYHELLSDHKVLLIGNRMQEGDKYFKKLGYSNIVGTISVDGINDVSNVLRKAKNYNFNIALVSAGIPANLICVELAKENKIAIDFGHFIDNLLKRVTTLKKTK